MAVSIYIIGYGFELRADTVEQITFFLKLEYFGAPFMSAFWLIFAYKFHYKKKPSMKTTLLIMLLPMLTTFLSATNEFHNLIYTDISAFEHEGYLLSILSKGIWYYVNVVYAYCAQLFGMYVFFTAWSNSDYKSGTPAYWMFIGSLWPTVVNIIYMSGLSPLSLDLTPFGLSLSAICFYVALFRYDFLELKEIVKDVAFSEINEGIIVIDDKNRLIDFNKACRQIFDWLDLKNIGKDVSLFKEGREILGHEDDHFEMQLVSKNTRKYYEFRRTALIENNKNVGYVYFVQDISRQKEMIQVLNHMANYDSLTQIYNRRRLIEEAEKALLQSRRYGYHISFLMIDIDHFKMINDKYGHLAGDEVLKTLVSACRDRIRRTDILGRFGGEEFLIIMPNTGSENAVKVAMEIKEAMENTRTLFNDSVISATISIGVSSALITDNYYSVDKLINNSDIALYEAKNTGRNRVCLYKGDGV